MHKLRDWCICWSYQKWNQYHSLIPQADTLQSSFTAVFTFHGIFEWTKFPTNASDTIIKNRYAWEWKFIVKIEYIYISNSTFFACEQLCMHIPAISTIETWFSGCIYASYFSIRCGFLSLPFSRFFLPDSIFITIQGYFCSNVYVASLLSSSLPHSLLILE